MARRSDPSLPIALKAKGATGRKAGLRPEDIATIRILFDSGQMTQAQLARLYGVSRTNIHYHLGRRKGRKPL